MSDNPTVADSLAESCKRMAKGIMKLRLDMKYDPIMEAYTRTHFPWNWNDYASLCERLEWELGEEP